MQRNNITSMLGLVALMLTTHATQADQPPQLSAVTVSASSNEVDSGESITLTRSLGGSELRRKAAASLGATLSQELGFSNASFGPGVGQPVIRGQSGARVQVMQNGVGNRDLSSLSPDHANASEALLADRIDWLRGPVALLYGSGLMGGALNVVDGRIPKHLLEKGLGANLEQRHDSAANENASVLRLDANSGPLAWHLDGFHRQRDDMLIPGAAHADGSGQRGKLPNSSSRAQSGSAGLSLIGDSGYLGASINRLENNYGIPPGLETDRVRINMAQTRYDAQGEWRNPLPFAQTVDFRVAHTDYHHVELENGLAGTRFQNQSTEGRFELHHQPIGIMHGLVGLQLSGATLSALGEEAVLPKSNLQTAAGFIMEHLDFNAWTLRSALRGENQSITPQGLNPVSHSPVSAAVEASWYISSNDSLTLGFTRSERAPQVQELFTNGIHNATSSYEIGDAKLNLETAHNLELGLKLKRDWAKLELDLYHNWANDYIYSANSNTVFDRDAASFAVTCPATADCLPVRRYRQNSAIFKGYEAKLQLPLAETQHGSFELGLFSDYVHGSFRDGSAVPLQPPLRYGTQLDHTSERWNNYLRITRGESQNRSGSNEAATAAYLRLDLGTEYRFGRAEGLGQAWLYAKGKNLLNEDIRSASSQLRNFAADAGRGAEVGLRLSF